MALDITKKSNKFEERHRNRDINEVDSNNTN